MNFPTSLSRLRLLLGWMLHEWHKRGLEFAVAGASLINARATLFQTADGKPIAPFLSSALDFLAYQPVFWTVFLAAVGLVHMALVIASFGREWFWWRVGACATQALIYVGVSAAIVTGPAPHEAGERYFFTAWLAFWVAIALAVEARQPDKWAKGGFDG